MQTSTQTQAPTPPAPPSAPYEPVIAAGQPGEPTIVVPAPGHDFPPIPQELVDISLAFFLMVAVCVVGWSFARALGRRFERRSYENVAIPAETSAQLLRIEQAVEAMAIEVERISESQRYLTRLQSGRERAPIAAEQP